MLVHLGVFALLCIFNRESICGFSFCTRHILDMRFIYLYIYFYAHGCAFYGFICDSFYDDMKCNPYAMYFYTCVCVLYMIMHDVVFVCFLYAIMNVTI